MRLIDADALLRYIEECNNIDEWCVSQYSADWISSFIENAPTVDIKTEVAREIINEIDEWISVYNGVGYVSVPMYKLKSLITELKNKYTKELKEGVK